jgi:hypothetical protein
MITSCVWRSITIFLNIFVFRLLVTYKQSSPEPSILATTSTIHLLKGMIHIHQQFLPLLLQIVINWWYIFHSQCLYQTIIYSSVYISLSIQLKQHHKITCELIVFVVMTHDIICLVKICFHFFYYV